MSPSRVFFVREQKQGFWQSLVATAYEVVPNGSETPLMTAVIRGGLGDSRLHIEMTASAVDAEPPRLYSTDKFGVGNSGMFSSFIVSEGHLGKRLCMVVPKVRLTENDQLMEDASRGYPAFFSSGEGDGRRLVASDHITELATLHRAWKDSERALHVVGSFELTEGLTPERSWLVTLAATAETLRDMVNNDTRY